MVRRLHRRAPQIRLAHARVPGELGATSAHHDAAGLQHVAAARGLQRVAGVLLDQQHAGAALVDRPDGTEDVAHDQRREPERGLVEAEQLWFGHHGAAEHEHLLFAARERAGVLAAALLQPREHVEDAVDHAADFRVIAPVLEPAELEVFARGEERKDVAAFRHQRDAGKRALVRGEPRDVFAAEADRARARRQQSRDGAQGGRFSGAVRADQRDDLALVHLDRDAAADRQLAIGELEVLGGEQRAHISSPPR